MDEIGKMNKNNYMPIHRQVILGSLSRIISTTLLIPLDVIQLRYRYPDTWCAEMFRVMVKSKDCSTPYEMMTATKFRKRVYRTLRWGVFYCLYERHRNIFLRNCSSKGLIPLYHKKYLLTGRPIVMQAIRLENSTAVLDYLHERRRIRDRKLILNLAKDIRSHLYSALNGFLFNMPTFNLPPSNWPFNTAVTTAVIASMLLHPLDVFKVRLQMYPEVWGISLLRNMLRCEGIRAPYTGLTASILRQTTYTATRLGAYYYMYEHQKRKYNRAPNFPEKLAIGMYAGVLGAFVGCPSEIVLVRMMADGPVDPFRRYKGPVDAFVKIWKSEGFNTFWRGTLLTMSRSVVISVAQIGTYAQARNFLVEKKRAHGFLLHLYTSMLASLVTAILTLPLDTFKTRYQVSSNESHREVYHKFRQETGVLGLYRGFTPYYVRLTVHTLITFYLLELLFEVHRNKKKRVVEK
ncbi:mitochondrial 2-oxoglutarate/malate carrier protein isoform X1 [Spodoptera frugiperda]|uniref:Mitochondrial 2-oxoglutarate/malate carrier protein isoform X1 n=1 Tax=Spodoptera frugiperda TaxID=7108 RepID=A0A9R0D7M7_SPOFR|nr:mitochondrial 2-oxoglutarate/malate carrier protein isoform X1 [Spodoptera frugiperda]